MWIEALCKTIDVSKMPMVRGGVAVGCFNSNRDYQARATATVDGEVLPEVTSPAAVKPMCQ
jgi:hypothetical protein